MKKILLILGVLLTLANNASSNGASQPIPPESDNIISSPQKGKDESEVLDRPLGPNTLDDSTEWYWASGKPVLDSMFDPETREPEWYWANGKPAFNYMYMLDLITLDDSAEWYWTNGTPAFDFMLDPNTLDNSPEWYWANGKPVKAPKDSELLGLNTLEPEWLWASGKPVLDSMFGPNILDDSPEWYWAYGKPVTKAPENDEALDTMVNLITLKPEWYWANDKPSDKAPKESEVVDIMFGRNALDDSPEWYWANGKPMIKAPKNDEAFIIADHVRQDVKKEIVWTWGKVKIRMENKTIHADKVKINNKTGKGEARGHVIIESTDGTKLNAKFTRFNINSHQGKLLKTRGRIGKTFIIKSRELIRHSKKRFTAKSGSLTTCKGKLPDWVFEADWMDIIKGDRAFITGGVLKVRNIPVLYVPAWYLPMNEERKSGFLFPEYGQSDVNGINFDNAYFWAINEHSDATFRLGYQGKRGFTPEIEYRYTPTRTTNGMFKGRLIKDRLTHETYWKVDANHSQALPNDFQFNGVLDLEGAEYNKTFTDNINLRNRRIANSFATLRKTWESHSFEILTRYRVSTDKATDGTLGELPQISYIAQTQKIGESDFYFGYNTVFTSYLTDIDPDPSVDNFLSVQRFHFNPTLTRSINIAPWLTFTGAIGLQETLFSKGQNNAGFFSREALNINANFKGPTVEKIYHTGSKLIPKIKHLLEPRLAWDFIPDLDRSDRAKIHSFASPVNVNPTSVLSYSLIQRFLQKEKNDQGGFNIREALRFLVSQSYDLREASRVGTAASPSRPFSDIRFDLDSRLVDPLLLNIDSNYDYNNGVFTNWNFQVGFRPMDALTFYIERRWTRRGDVSSVATLDVDFLKGWNLRASTRLDEVTDTHRENNLSLVYDDPCKCYAFGIDYINRNNFNATSRDAGGAKESKWLFNFTFRGLGDYRRNGKENFIHRSFEPLNPSKAYLRKQKRRLPSRQNE